MRPAPHIPEGPLRRTRTPQAADGTRIVRIKCEAGRQRNVDPDLLRDLGAAVVEPDREPNWVPASDFFLVGHGGKEQAGLFVAESPHRKVPDTAGTPRRAPVRGRQTLARD